MTTIILVVIGVLLAALAALMVVFYGGDVFGRYKNEAEAGRLVSEGAQVEAAIDLYHRTTESYPGGSDPVQTLIDSDYLTHKPKGAKAGQWVIDYDEGFIRSSIGPSDDESSLDICRTARVQLKLPEAPTDSGVYKCDGSDAPGGRLSSREPCCIRG